MNTLKLYAHHQESNKSAEPGGLMKSHAQREESDKSAEPGGSIKSHAQREESDKSAEQVASVACPAPVLKLLTSPEQACPDGGRVQGRDLSRDSSTATFLSPIPSPEVVERPRRRKYSLEYKRRILEETDSANRPGAVGAILRREGLYASTLASWRRQREHGLEEGLRARKRGPKSVRSSPLERRLKEMERENRRLQKRLKYAELLLEIQKKISEITGIPLKDLENGDDD